jgi:hypothetical protein
MHRVSLALPTLQKKGKSPFVKPFWSQIHRKKCGFSRFFQDTGRIMGYNFPQMALRFFTTKYLVAIGEIVRGVYVRQK